MHNGLKCKKIRLKKNSSTCEVLASRIEVEILFFAAGSPSPLERLMRKNKYFFEINERSS